MKYLELQKAVFDSLYQKHRKSPEFTFSVRKKASKGAELNYFIGTEKSNYFSFTLWAIPSWYRGASTEVISYIIRPFDNGYVLILEYFMARNQPDVQNQLTIEFGYILEKKLKENNLLDFVSPTQNKMYQIHHDYARELSDEVELLEAINKFIDQTAPVIQEAIDETKAKYKEWEASKINLESFNDWIIKLEERRKKYTHILEAKEEETNRDEAIKTTSTAYDGPFNTILYGPPGTGKTYNTVNRSVAIAENISIDELEELYPTRTQVKSRFNELVEKQRIRFITFHQSYSYEDFIEGIKPVINTGKDKSSGDIVYNVVDGTFKLIVNDAKEQLVDSIGDSERNFVLIIDEINRGNIASIFGELITLIEDDKREGRNEQLNAILPYSKSSFNVPNNLYLIGTMNTADRSVEALDTALRRRFEFHEMPPMPEILPGPGKFINELWNRYSEDDWDNILYMEAEKKVFDFIGVPNSFVTGMEEIEEKWDALENDEEKIKYLDEQLSECNGVDLGTLLATVNKRIEKLIDKDHCIGHSYFIDLDKTDNPLKQLRIVFDNKIVPLLKEFFFNDFGKIGLILGQDFVKSTEKLLDKDIFADFKTVDEHNWMDKSSYIIHSCEEQKMQIGTFIGIYNKQVDE